MELFFSPFACSLASRISLYEAGMEDKVAFRQVNLRTKRLVADDADFRAINPGGMVPTLKADDGTILCENPAILSFIADQFPEAHLGAATPAERYAILRWLSFAGTELHKAVFTPLFSPMANDGAKEFARACAPARFSLLDAHLAGREFVAADHFTIADAYLTTVLSWAKPAGIDLTPWTAVVDYVQRMSARPAVARAFEAEAALLKKPAA